MDFDQFFYHRTCRDKNKIIFFLLSIYLDSQDDRSCYPAENWQQIVRIQLFNLCRDLGMTLYHLLPHIKLLSKTV